MTTPRIACDVSSWQKPVDDSYPHHWLIFRCCDGSYPDPNCVSNSAWAARALAAGRIDGWTAYVVFRPGKNAAILEHTKHLPAGGFVMIDAESWNGQLAGDHSDEINALADGFAARFGRARVWGYGNLGPDMAVWPRKPAWMGRVIASYGSRKPSVPNMVGWQYTDGSGRWPGPTGMPHATPPFGRCDHNILYLPTSGDTLSAAEVTDIKATIAATSAADRAWLQSYIDAKLGGTINRVVADAANSAAAVRLLSDPANGLLARVVDLQKRVAGLPTTAMPAAPVDVAAVTRAARDGAADGANLTGKTLTIGGTA